jgi:serine/threonine protein phosphatase 1
MRVFRIESDFFAIKGMGRKFVIGDIHGAYRALIQCLERASFDREADTLICLGDVCDGWPETKRCIDELLRISNLVYVMGNHDTWLLQWMKTGEVENIWYLQGGEATITSYAGNPIPVDHLNFLSSAKPYHLQENRLFVHAGIKTAVPLEQQGTETFFWDRTLVKLALNHFSKGQEGELTSFKEIFVGHTPTGYRTPIKACEVWMMDTGAGWSGVLSMMEIDSKEVFTSDPVPSLYPGVKGRSKF